MKSFILREDEIIICFFPWSVAESEGVDISGEEKLRFVYIVILENTKWFFGGGGGGR